MHGWQMHRRGNYQRKKVHDMPGNKRLRADERRSGQACQRRRLRWRLLKPL